MMETLDKHPLDSFSIRRSPLVLLLLLVGAVYRFFIVRHFETAPNTSAEEFFILLGGSWSEDYRLSLDGHPTAGVMPGYPILLGIQKLVLGESMSGVVGMQILLGTICCWLGARIAWKTFRQPAAFWSALLILLFHPAFAAVCGELEPVILTTFLFLLGTWLLVFTFRPSLHLVCFLMAAVVFSASIYFSLLPLLAIPVMAIGLGFLAHERLVGVLGGIAVCLAVSAALMPWMGRNLLVMGTFIPLTTSLPLELESALIQRNEPTSTRIRIVTGEGEVEDYQRALSRLSPEVQKMGARDWITVGTMAFTQWWSDYPVLFAKLHTPPKLWLRVLLFTLGITLFFLALIGVLPTLNSGRTWVFILVLGIFGIQHALFSLPPYRHLVAFPILVIFSARGVAQISILFTKNWRSTPPEPPLPTPTWVSENEYVFQDPYLEPIKGPKKGAPETDQQGSGRLGPLF